MSVICKYISAAILGALMLAIFGGVWAANDDVTVNLLVGCNGNSLCESDLEENRLNCVSDCPICDESGICDAAWGETRVNCVADCTACDRNGICESEFGETEGNCVSDCPATGCNNNGVCEAVREENTDNCPADCLLPEPEEKERGGQPGQKLAAPEIGRIEVFDITLMSARISWSTDIAARCQVNFGDSSEYESGIVYEMGFAKGGHSANISGLKAQTIYHFKISCANINGVVRRSDDWQFTTMFLPDALPPANVSDFQAVAAGNLIKLRWVNPGEEDWAGVKILRAEKFYPQDLMTGQIVYDGRQKLFEDNNVIAGKTYYYTAFAYDHSGNYSSGAIASAIVGEPGKGAEIPAMETPIELQALGLAQFIFTQNGQVIEARDGKIGIDRFHTFKISIPYDAVPEVLKTIIVTLKEDGKMFSFLLRVNKDKTAYEATIVSPGMGEYPFDITILDYKNQALKKISGDLKVLKAEIMESQSEIITTRYVTIKKMPPIIYILVVLMVLVLAKKIYRTIRKRRKEKTPEEVDISL